MHDEKLSEVICETAEQIFYEEFVEAENADVPNQAFWATVQVHSPERFEVVVVANDEDLRQNLSAMFSGKEITNSTLQDMVAELANTIAGSLGRRLSDERDLELTPPQKGLGEPPSAETYHGFTGDDLTLFVAVRSLCAAAE